MQERQRQNINTKTKIHKGIYSKAERKTELCTKEDRHRNKELKEQIKKVRQEERKQDTKAKYGRWTERKK